MAGHFSLAVESNSLPTSSSGYRSIRSSCLWLYSWCICHYLDGPQITVVIPVSPVGFLAKALVRFSTQKRGVQLKDSKAWKEMSVTALTKQACRSGRGRSLHEELWEAGVVVLHLASAIATPPLPGSRTVLCRVDDQQSFSSPALRTAGRVAACVSFRFPWCTWTL